MNFHNLIVYNKPVLYVGAILTFTGTYLDNTSKGNLAIIWALLILGLILMLLSFKKPDGNKNEEPTSPGQAPTLD